MTKTRQHNNDLSRQELKDVNYWLDRFKRHDWYYMYSDDFSVWSHGQVVHDEMRHDFHKADLSDEAKEVLLRLIGYEWDANYKASRERYGCIAESPLWDEPGNRDRDMYASFMGLGQSVEADSER